MKRDELTITVETLATIVAAIANIAASQKDNLHIENLEYILRLKINHYLNNQFNMFEKKHIIVDVFSDSVENIHINASNNGLTIFSLMIPFNK